VFISCSDDADWRFATRPISAHSYPQCSSWRGGGGRGGVRPPLHLLHLLGEGGPGWRGPLHFFFDNSSTAFIDDDLVIRTPWNPRRRSILRGPAPSAVHQSVVLTFDVEASTLQSVLRPCLIYGLRRFHLVSDVLNWLRIRERIQFKLAVLVPWVLLGNAPE